MANARLTSKKKSMWRRQAENLANWAKRLLSGWQAVFRLMNLRQQRNNVSTWQKSWLRISNVGESRNQQSSNDTLGMTIRWISKTTIYHSRELLNGNERTCLGIKRISVILLSSNKQPMIRVPLINQLELRKKVRILSRYPDSTTLLFGLINCSWLDIDLHTVSITDTKAIVGHLNDATGPEQWWQLPHIIFTF